MTVTKTLGRAMRWFGAQANGDARTDAAGDRGVRGGTPAPGRAALLLLLAALAVAVPRQALAQDVGIAVGTQAPRSIPLERLDGTRADLSQYIGRQPVLLQFWAAWCSSCHGLAPKVAAVRQKYGDRMRFVGIAVAVNQSPRLAKRYAERHGTPLELFYDREGTAAEAFEAPGTSYVVVLDRTGRVVYTGIGGDQNLEAAVRKALGA